MKKAGLVLVATLVVVMLFSVSAETFEDDFEDMSNWTCVTEPGDGMGGDTFSGVCETDNSSLLVREETNNPRTVTRSVDLPEESAYIQVDMETTVSDSWSKAQLEIVTDSDKEYIAGLNNRYTGMDRNCSNQGWRNISGFAGEEVELRFRANGRRMYDTADTMSTIEVGEIAITGEKPSGKELEDCGKEGMHPDARESSNTTYNYTLRRRPPVYGPETSRDVLSSIGQFIINLIT